MLSTEPYSSTRRGKFLHTVFREPGPKLPIWNNSDFKTSVYRAWALPWWTSKLLWAGHIGSDSAVDISHVPNHHGMESQILYNTVIRQLPLNGKAELKSHLNNAGCSIAWNGTTNKGYTWMPHNTSIIKDIFTEYVIMAPCPNGSDLFSSGNTFGPDPDIRI